MTPTVWSSSESSYIKSSLKSLRDNLVTFGTVYMGWSSLAVKFSTFCCNLNDPIWLAAGDSDSWLAVSAGETTSNRRSMKRTWSTVEKISCGDRRFLTSVCWGNCGTLKPISGLIWAGIWLPFGPSEWIVLASKMPVMNVKRRHLLRPNIVKGRTELGGWIISWGSWAGHRTQFWWWVCKWGKFSFESTTHQLN